MAWANGFEGIHRFLIGSVVFLAGCTSGLIEDSLRTILPAESRLFEEASSLVYTMSFEDLEDQDLLEFLEEVSSLKAQQGSGVSSFGVLRGRVADDEVTFTKALQSVGYFDASVTGHVAPPLQNQGGRRTHVIFVFDIGPLYPIATFDFVYEKLENVLSEDTLLPKDAFEIGLEKDAPARGDTILSFEDKIIETLQQRGHPVAHLGSRSVVVDRKAKTVAVTMRIAPERVVIFGSLTITGLDSVNEAYVRYLVGWQEDTLYDVRITNRASTILRETELFSTVDFDPVKPLEEGGVIPMTLELKEREEYSVGGGVRWSTDDGASVRAFWESRNLFGNGEALRLSSNYGDSLKSILSVFSRPHFARLDQNLDLGLEVAEEDTDAYLERRFRWFATIDRRISNNLSGSAGVTYLSLSDRAVGERQEARLIGVPLSLRWDYSDDLLDPRRGWRLSIRATPYIRVGSLNVSERTLFVRSSASGSFYVSPNFLEDFTWANRIAVGSIGANSLDDLPRSLRFYTGGDGSVRGYERQRAGRIDKNVQPTGGRSFSEISSEVRYYVSDAIGFVAFIDGGNSYESIVPDDTKVFWGTGVGMRYNSRVGPIRLDIATPLDRRKDIDSQVQIYVSLGQAF
ncbi:MAG: autotransporter assembly complex family protein [Parvularculales bacterium]